MAPLFAGSFDDFRIHFPHLVPPERTYDMVYVLRGKSVYELYEVPYAPGSQSVLWVIQEGAIVALHYVIDVGRAYERCDIMLEAQSSLYMYVECNNNELFPRMHINFYLAGNSSVSCFSTYMSTQTYPLEMNYACNMQGHYAQAFLYMLYGMSGTQNATINTRQHHYVPHAQSLVSLKGVVADKAHLAYNGRITIDKGAHYTNAEQQNKNMVWGNQARAVATPSLEVNAHQVQCKHGSATGYFDALHVFYMQSRGLDAQTVQQLLLNGFFQDSIIKSDIELWNESIAQNIDAYVNRIVI